MKLFVCWLAIALLSFSTTPFAEGGEAGTLEKAVTWLLDQQDDSGAFKSKHYGAMKQGAAITSLVVYSLSGLSDRSSFTKLPDELRSNHASAIDKAFEFLLEGTVKRGQVANPDGSLDHPVYSTAMFLTAAKRTGHKLDRKLVRKLLAFLVDSQCTEKRGFNSKDPNYGGWDVLGPAVMPGKTSGTNVSVTRFVLEAFEYWVPYDDSPDAELLDHQTVDLVNESRAKAGAWIKRLHVASGESGFVFTAQPGSALNKSKGPKGSPRPYSSATSDGISVYLFTSSDWSSKEYQGSLRWLVENVESARVAGFDDSGIGGWADALQFYHLQSLARLQVHGDGKVADWFSETRKAIASTLAERQKADGSFQNESALMRENDPLIATSFAIIALGIVEP